MYSGRIGSPNNVQLIAPLQHFCGLSGTANKYKEHYDQKVFVFNF